MFEIILFHSKTKGHEALVQKSVNSIFKHISKNSYLQNDKVINANVKKQTRNKAEREAYRGSQFRGVSVNGSKWQVFIIIKNKKYYAGQMDTEAEAAKLYDKLILLHCGLSAKTNFSYTAQQLKEIVTAKLNNEYWIFKIKKRVQM